MPSSPRRGGGDAGLFSALESGEIDPGRLPQRQRSAAVVLRC